MESVKERNKENQPIERKGGQQSMNDMGAVQSVNKEPWTTEGVDPRTATKSGRVLNATKGRVRRQAGVVLALASAFLLTVSWSGSAFAQTDHIRSESASSEPTISVGLPAAITVLGAPYVAQAEGYFAKEGVKVNLVQAGAVEDTQLESGSLDLLDTDVPEALNLTNAGTPTKVLFCDTGNGGDNIVVAANSTFKPKSSTEATIMELSGAKVGTFAAGTAVYAEAVEISNYIKAHGGQPLNIVTLSSVSAIADELVAGTIQATVGSGDVFESDLQSGAVRFLVSDTNSTMEKLTGGLNLSLSGVFGLSSHLPTIKTGTSRFLAAMVLADQYMRTHSADQVATALRTQAPFASYTVPQLAYTIKLDVPLLDPNGGHITEAQWKTTLKSWMGTGFTEDLNSSKFSYNNQVDMSYLKDGNK